MNNLYGNQVPVMVVDVSTSVTFDEWCDSVSGSAEIDVQASFFNQKLLEYEPILEPWQYNLRVSKESTNEGGSVEVLLRSRERAELTLSHAFLLTMNDFVYSLEKEAAQKRKKYCPYRVVNKTGITIEYSLSGVVDPVWCGLKDGGEVEIEFDNEEDGGKIMKKYTPHSVSKSVNKKLISFQIPDFETVSGASLEKISTQVYNLSPKKDYLYRVVSDLVVENGVKVFTLHSPLECVNSTDEDVDVGIQKGEHSEIKPFLTLKPLESFYMPIKFVYSHRIYIKPAGKAVEWCHKGIFWYNMHKKGISTRKMHFHGN